MAMGNAKLLTQLSSRSASMSDLASSLSAELNFTDLELLHQYLTYTCIADSQLPEITAYIHKTILPLALAHPFVMRGILAMAAIHLSRLRPSCQVRYEMIATKHHDSALPYFRSALRSINQENFQALISYSKGLLWCSLAKDGSSREINSNQSSESSWIPQWFHLLRGSCQIVETSRAWIQAGPHLRPEFDSTIDYSENPAVQQVSALMAQLYSITKSVICETVLSALRESFARASMDHINTPYRNAINFWIASLPYEYFTLLENNEPWALVALSYFCVLLYHSEPTWFVRCNTTILMVSVTDRLCGVWKDFAKWPCTQLGIL